MLLTSSTRQISILCVGEYSIHLIYVSVVHGLVRPSRNT